MFVGICMREGAIVALAPQTQAAIKRRKKALVGETARLQEEVARITYTHIYIFYVRRWPGSPWGEGRGTQGGEEQQA